MRTFSNFLVFIGLCATSALAQNAECKTASGLTACGYHCVAASGQVKCAQTPGGICTAQNGVVTCWDPPMHVLPLAQGIRPECKTVSGVTACGFHCEARFGQVKCAQTPAGSCTANNSQVTCWDGPSSLPNPNVLARPECKTAYGATVCGFACTAAYGEIACAATAQGACMAAYGKIVCWDPPSCSEGIWPPPEKASCTAAYGEVGCGYGCMAAYGELKCAQKPGHSCVAAYGRVVCSDANQ
jgi:hypothetical protein